MKDDVLKFQVIINECDVCFQVRQLSTWPKDLETIKTWLLCKKCELRTDEIFKKNSEVEDFIETYPAEIMEATTQFKNAVSFAKDEFRKPEEKK